VAEPGVIQFDIVCLGPDTKRDGTPERKDTAHATVVCARCDDGDIGKLGEFLGEYPEPGRLDTVVVRQENLRAGARYHEYPQ